MWVLAGWIWRDDSLAAALGQPVSELFGVIGAVGYELTGRGNARQKRGCPDQVMGLAGCQSEGDGPARSVGQGMNFGRPSAARPADGVLEIPPFAPAADRCALT